MTSSSRADVERVRVPHGGFRRIAVLRLSSLGDVILALPVVHELARAFPGARIEFWTKEEYAEVARFDPAITHVRSLERDARRIEDLVSMSAELEDCDLIVDLHGSLRTRLLTFRQRARVLHAASCRVGRTRWVRARWTRPGPLPHALERYARALRPIGLTSAESPRVTVDPAAEAWAENWLQRWPGSASPVALCPGARHATKRRQSYVDGGAGLAALEELRPDRRSLQRRAVGAERLNLQGLVALRGELHRVLVVGQALGQRGWVLAGRVGRVRLVVEVGEERYCLPGDDVALRH
jgi:hypothetical protein